MVRHGDWSAGQLRRVVWEFGLEPLGFTPVRRAWRVETAEGPRFLKCTALSPAELAFVTAAAAHLRSRGEPAPQFHTDHLGRPYVARPGYSFVLTDWLTGREADFDDPEDLGLAVKAVARLHWRGEGFIAPPSGRVRVEWGHWPEKFGRRVVLFQAFREAALAVRGEFDHAYLALWDYHAGRAKEALRLLEGSVYPRLISSHLRAPVICHHDLSKRNFLIREAEACLVDFDYCVQDHPVHDLANLLQRLGQSEDWETGKAEGVLAAYDRLCPLSRGERNLLLALLVWPHRFWLLGWQHYVERLPWAEERWLGSVRRRGEEAGPRERFVSALGAWLGRPRSERG